MSVPYVGCYGVQRVVLLAKTLHFIHMRGILQSAVELVCPGVVRALNSSGESTLVLVAEQGTAMAADVVECTDIPKLIADDDDAGICHAPHKIVARIGDLVCASRAQPHIEVDRFHFAL